MPSRSLHQRLPISSGAEGFVYVGQGDNGPMLRAKAGNLVDVPGHGPPWIVVDQTPATVIVADWPGRLWRVQIVEAAEAKDQPPLASARYTRAVAVRVVQEENPAQLFGPEGEAVLRVLDAASKLERPRAEVLASRRDPDAAAVKDKVWRIWIDRRGPDAAIDPETADGIVTCGSPINSGLSVLYQVIFDRAKSLEGEAAIEDDGEDIWLVAPWNGAAAALADAALALGAPSMIGPEDREILLRAWQSTYL